MSAYTYSMVLLSVFLQSFSFLTIKYASTSSVMYAIVLIVSAFAFIIARAFLWQRILKHNELSKVYPFNSLVQVLIFLYAIFLFDEIITVNNIVGLSFMLFGVILLGKKND